VTGVQVGLGTRKRKELRKRNHFADCWTPACPHQGAFSQANGTLHDEDTESTSGTGFPSENTFGPFIAWHVRGVEIGKTW